MSKKWYLSKTVWINALLLGAAVTTALMNDQTMHEYAPYIISINTIINILLRFMSTGKLEG